MQPHSVYKNEGTNTVSSTNTITQAENKYMTFPLANWGFTHIRDGIPPGRATGGSNVQSFLLGMEYLLDIWRPCHITLSPTVRNNDVSMYFDSAHLTVTGGPHNGNWFFGVSDDDIDIDYLPPNPLRGHHTHSGRELPNIPLVTNLTKLLYMIAYR